MNTIHLIVPGQDKEQLSEINQSLSKGESIAHYELVEPVTLRPSKN